MQLFRAGNAAPFCVPKPVLAVVSSIAEKVTAKLANKHLLATLIRLPRSMHSLVALTCPLWNTILKDGAFVKARQKCPLTGLCFLEQTIIRAGGMGVRSDGAIKSIQEENNERAHGWDCHAEGSMLESRGEWIKIAPLPEKTTGHSLVVAAGEVFSLGGSHNANSFFPSTCPCVVAWSPATNEWRPVSGMPDGGRSLATIIGHKDKVWRFGGQQFGSDSPENMVYDPLTDTWLPIAPLPKGGRDDYGDSFSDSGFAEDEAEEEDQEEDEEEDEEDDSWYEFCHAMGAAAVGDKIILFGGQHGTCNTP